MSGSSEKASLSFRGANRFPVYFVDAAGNWVYAWATPDVVVYQKTDCVSEDGSDLFEVRLNAFIDPSVTCPVSPEYLEDVKQTHGFGDDK